MKRPYWLSLPAMAALLLAFPAPAQAAAPGSPSVPAITSVNRILAGVSALNPSLESFQAPVHVDVHMRSFPWLSPQLDGTSYFKRPDNYEVVFNRVPSYAHGINRLFGDIDDVAAWEKDSNIAYAGLQTVGGRSLYALRMTKKIYSDQIADTVAYVDPQNYEVVRMDFHYRNGGTITMTQAYRREGKYTVVASQHAEIHIPHVSAVAQAQFGRYQTNVAVSDNVFTGK